MTRLGKIRDALNKAEIPDSVDIAKAMLDEHNSMKKRISKAPIEALEAEGRAIQEKICGSRHQSQGQLQGQIYYKRHYLHENQGRLQTLLSMFDPKKQSLNALASLWMETN